MKTKILILLFGLISFLGFSQSNRVLTETERQSLLTSTLFNEKCQMAIRDYAVYWSGHTGFTTTNGGADGGLANTEAARIQWAKNRIKGIGILLGGINNVRINEIFINASKGKQLSLAAAPLDAATIIAAWDVNSTFEEFVSQYFDAISTDIIFKIGQ